MSGSKQAEDGRGAEDSCTRLDGRAGGALGPGGGSDERVHGVVGAGWWRWHRIAGPPPFALYGHICNIDSSCRENFGLFVRGGVDLLVGCGGQRDRLPEHEFCTGAAAIHLDPYAIKASRMAHLWDAAVEMQFWIPRRHLEMVEAVPGLTLDPMLPETVLVFCALTIFANSVCPLPLAGPLCIASVLLYGPVVGFFANIVLAVVGCYLCLVVTRCFRPGCIARLPPHVHATWNSLDAAVSREGFTLPLLFRLTPVMPVVLSNVCLSLTSVDTWTFCWTTFVGFIPSSLPYAYTAVVGKELMNEFPPRDPVLFTVTLLGLAATLLAVYKIGSIAMAELTKAGVGPGAAASSAASSESPTQVKPSALDLT